ncbi:hypothetical protein K438DRAFT_1828289, partial [Mycena galopus ATCC 62051]
MSTYSFVSFLVLLFSRLLSHATCLALPSLLVHPALTLRPAPPALPDAHAHRICLLCSLLLLCWVSVSSDDDYFLLRPPFMSTRSSAARGPGANSVSSASSVGVSKAAADEEKEEEVGQTMRIRRCSGKGEGKRTDADQEVEEVEGGVREAGS